MRAPYAEHPGLLERVFDLLATAFPGIKAARRAAECLDWRWQDVSTPFVHFEDDRLLAHVGVLELPLVLEGERRLVGGLHAVVTRATHRRRGHARRLLEEALAWCDDRYETLVLSTAAPRVYESVGFRVLPECFFRSELAVPGNPRAMRRMRLDDAGDRALLDRLLATRTPVSQRVGVAPEAAVFKFNQAQQPLWYWKACDALVVFEIEAGRCRVLDLVAPALPPLAALARALPEAADALVLGFAPDRFEGRFGVEPGLRDDHYMVRGPFAAEGLDFTVPVSARH